MAVGIVPQAILASIQQMWHLLKSLGSLFLLSAQPEIKELLVVLFINFAQNAF